jgi:hypothetical protein
MDFDPAAKQLISQPIIAAISPPLASQDDPGFVWSGKLLT